MPSSDISVVTDEADNCDPSPIVAHEGDTQVGDVITRTYRVTDASGNSITVEQIITINDTTNPTASNPSPLNIECIGDLPSSDISVVTDEADNCDPSPIVAHEGDTQVGDVITRTYSVTDVSGNSITVEQIITIEDVTNPVISTCPTTPASLVLGASCEATVPDLTGDVVASDNCTTSGNFTITQLPVAGTKITSATTVTITVEDETGNSTTCTVDLEVDSPPTLSITSTISPSCNGSDGSITFSFTNVSDGDYPVAFDGGSFGNVTVASGSGTISGISQGTYNNISIAVTGCSSNDGINIELDCKPPIADDENVTIAEDTPVTVSAVTGDIDPDGTVIPSTIVLTDPNNPSNVGNSSTPVVIVGEGTYTVDVNGNVTFTPELNFNGVSRINYTIEDNDGNLSNIATITVTVTPLNDGPEAIDDVESIGPGETLSASVVPNDTADPEGDNVSYSVVGGTTPNETTEGTLSFNPDGTYTFIPVAEFTGLVEYDYEVCDDGSPVACSRATVSINVGTNEPPVADNETISTDEDTAVTLDITDGDTDSDGTIVPSSIILIDPTNTGITGNSSTPLQITGEGIYSVDVNGNLTFTPESDFNGTSSVNYTIKDNLGAKSNVATVTVTVDPINDGPEAVDDEETMSPGTTLTSSVVPNDIPDPEGDELTYTVVSGTEPNPTTEGSLTFNPDGSYTFTPVGGFEGEVTFEYEVCDDGVPSACSTATVTIDVTNNIPPVADNESATTDEDKQITILVVEGDTDADGTINPGSIVLIDPNDSGNTGSKTKPLEIAGEGTYEVDNLGNVTFIPAFNFNGQAQVNYTVKDNLGATSNVAEVVITVTPLNDAPIADNETASIAEDTPVTIDITDGDIDFDGTIVPSTIKLIDPNNPSIVGNSSTPLVIIGEGTYTVDASGNMTFTPETNFTGVSSVNYTVEDNDGALSNVARVDITVTPSNDGPEAIDDVESVNPGEVLTSSVVPNDVPDPEGDALSYSVVSGATPDETTEGTLSFNPDGSYTFTPVAGFSGLVEFEYEVCDDGTPSQCSTATVSINVGTNEPPVADNESISTGEDMAVTLDVTDGDTDSDGTIVPSTIVLIDPANNGHTGSSSSPLVIIGEGTYTVDATGNVTFTPVANFNGTSSVNYTIKDNLGAKSNVATVTVTVDPINDGPEAIDDQETMSPGTTLTSSVVPNDIPDPEGDNLTYTVVSGTAPNPTTEGSLTFNPDGSYSFTPVGGFLGTVTFQYQVCDDGSPSGCSTAVVSITVTSNIPPVADNDDAIITEDNPVTIFIINGDVDADGTLNPFEIVLIDPVDPSHTGDNTRPLVIAGEGVYTVDPLGNVTFTPENNYAGTSIINYTIEDNLGAVSNIATITITVTPANDPPVAVDDEESTDEDTPITGDVLTNDSDPEGDNLTVNTTQITGPTNGTLVLNANGTFTYTPNDMFNGTDSFVYEVCDDGSPSLCDRATVNITVGAVNDPPVATDDEGETEFETPVSGNLITNDEDPDGDNLTVSTTPVTPPSNGTVILNPDGTYTYTPEDGFVGTDTFVYQVCDDGSPVICDEATVTITVNSTNGPPIAVEDENITDSITPAEGNVLDNDSDPNGDNLTVNTSPVLSPTNGTLILNPDGSYIYTPDARFEGIDTFEYEVCDDGVPSLCTTALVFITVEKPPLDIPQIFGGPNNPSWYIEGIEEYPNNHVQVFNRWGNQVFELKGYDNNSRNWASESTVGIIIGSNQVPDGTYFYVIDLGDGSKPKSGFVVVNR